MSWIRDHWNALLPTQRVAFVLAPIALVIAIYVQRTYLS